MQNSVHEKKDCCGCAMCADACPKNAIQMKEDEFGFTYPVIDQEKCVACGKCNQLCAFTYPTEPSLQDTYLAASKDGVLKQLSASGGIFAEAALHVIKKGGIVWGAAFEPGTKSVRHIPITKEDDIPKLQGSKYTQSNTEGVYQKIKQQLEQGKLVLFSGTPCQCAALKSFVRERQERLFLIDLVCHGVPSQNLFKQSIVLEEKRFHGKLENIQFRSKELPWGNFVAKLTFRRINGKLIERYCIPAVFSYYKLFLESKTYRESCYYCRYTSDKRISDWTICDYWGVSDEHPNLDEKLLQEFRHGASGIIVNSVKGRMYFGEIQEHLIVVESTFDKLARHNEQLKHPVQIPEERVKIMDMIKRNKFWRYDRNLHFQIALHNVFYEVKTKLFKR